MSSVRDTDGVRGVVVMLEYEVLFLAGYRREGQGVGTPAVKLPWHHVPCGSAVWGPDKHDGYCPANGDGRTEPLLRDIRP